MAVRVVPSEEPFSFDLARDYVLAKEKMTLTPGPIEGCFIPASREESERLVSMTVAGMGLKDKAFKFEKCWIEIPRALASTGTDKR